MAILTLQASTDVVLESTTTEDTPTQRNMHRHEHILAKIDSISEELRPIFETIMSCQAWLAGRRGFWQRVRAAQAAGSVDRELRREALKRLDATIATYRKFKSAYKAMVDAALAIDWAEISVASV